MKKIFAVFLAVMTLTAFFTVAPAAAASSGEYAFINAEKGTTGNADVTFNVSKGKSAISLTLNKKEVVQGDGVTPWETGLLSADKNWEYDSENGTLTISQRYIIRELDLFGAREIKFSLNYSDSTNDEVTLKGVYNYVSAPTSVGNYTDANPAGYKDTELKPDQDWKVTASSASEGSPARYIDGTKASGHSYYRYEGGFVTRYNAPHYVVLDLGKKTAVSGVRYLPRTSNEAGSWTDVIYEGSDDGVNFSQIGKYKYPGTKEETVTDFGKNVSYRYYRAKITAATSGYATGTELHLIKPKAVTGDKTVDISSDAVWETGEYGKSVTAVYLDGAAVSEENYSLANGKFTLKNAFIREKGEGTYAFKAVFSDSFIECNLTVRDDSALLAATKEKAIAELNAFGKAEGYKAGINSQTSVDGVYAALDAAEKALGAEIVSLEYGKSTEISSPEIVYQTVNNDGDTSVANADGEAVTAVGLGRAIVKSGTKKYVIKTERSKIALVLLSGQSNAAGDESDYTLAPSAVGKYKNRYFITNSINLTRALSDITMEDAIFTARNGGRPDVDDTVWTRGNGKPLHSAAEASQLGARLSDEWDMPVWVVNTAVCSQLIQRFDPTLSGSTSYTGSVNYINKVRSLIAEDGHYEIDETKTGMFWLQGESNGIGNYCTPSTMEEYREMFMNMYSGFADEIGINYCGIWLVRGRVTQNAANDFDMSGPRLAQIYMTNSVSEEYKNIYLVLNTDLWKDGTNAYFEKRHPDAAAFKAYYGYDRPTTMTEIKPGLHHSQKGYNELGDEAGEVIAKIMNGKTESVTEAYLAGFDGSEATEFSVKFGESAYAVPMVKEPYYNPGYNLTVRISDETVARFDETTFTIEGLKNGETEAALCYGDTVLKTYPLTVSGGADTEDKTLTDRTKWTLTASSRWNEGRDVKNLTDSNTATSWTADINQKLPDNEQWVEITLPEETLVSGFAFNSYSTDENGFPTAYEIYVDSGAGEYIKAAEGTYSVKDWASAKKYTIGFSKNYTAKKVKFLFKNGVGGYAAMGEVYLTGNNSSLPEYGEDVKIAVSKVQSGVYSDNTGIIRFITEIKKIPSGAEVEYFGSYAVKSSAFDKDSLDETLMKKAVPVDGTVIGEGDTWAFDIEDIEADNFNDAVMELSFIKLKGENKIYYSSPKLFTGVDTDVNLGQKADNKSFDVNKSTVKIHGRYYDDSGRIISSQPASGIEVRFSGTELSLDLSVNNDAYIHVFIDDNIELFFDYQYDNRTFIPAGDSRITLCKDLPEGEHSVKILKANEGMYNKITWKKLYTDGEILEPAAEKTKKIQFVGDSITCCASSLNFPENSGGNGAGIKYEDSLHSYASYVGRAFDADVELFARSGLSMYNCMRDKEKWYSTPLYEQVDPFAGLGYNWDHTNFEPDLIVQFNWINEYQGKMLRDGISADVITEVYVEMIKMFKKDHPNAKLMLVCRDDITEFIGVLNAAIKKYGEAEGDTSWITVMTYNKSALVNSGHPHPEGQSNIAKEFVPQIEEFMGWNAENK